MVFVIINALISIFNSDEITKVVLAVAMNDKLFRAFCNPTDTNFEVDYAFVFEENCFKKVGCIDFFSRFFIFKYLFFLIFPPFSEL